MLETPVACIYEQRYNLHRKRWLGYSLRAAKLCSVTCMRALTWLRVSLGAMEGVSVLMQRAFFLCTSVLMQHHNMCTHTRHARDRRDRVELSGLLLCARRFRCVRCVCAHGVDQSFAHCAAIGRAEKEILRKSSPLRCDRYRAFPACVRRRKASWRPGVAPDVLQGRPCLLAW